MLQMHLTGQRILTAPYETRDGWDLNVMSVNGTLYLEEHSNDEKLQEKYTPLVSEQGVALLTIHQGEEHDWKESTADIHGICFRVLLCISRTRPVERPFTPARRLERGC